MENKQNMQQSTNDDNIKPGSQITDPEEKELRKYDDWRSHRHEKHRDLNEEFRTGELHGVVGKEIIGVVEKDKPRQFKNQNIDYGLDINKDSPKKSHMPRDYNNKALDPRPQENINAIKETEKMLEKIEHQSMGNTSQGTLGSNMQQTGK
jgi:hypothetical protein